MHVYRIRLPSAQALQWLALQWLQDGLPDDSPLLPALSEQILRRGDWQRLALLPPNLQQPAASFHALLQGRPQQALEAHPWSGNTRELEFKCKCGYDWWIPAYFISTGKIVPVV